MKIMLVLSNAEGDCNKPIQLTDNKAKSEMEKLQNLQEDIILRIKSTDILLEKFAQKTFGGDAGTAKTR